MEVHELEAHLAALTDHQKKVLEIIYRAGSKWMGRSEIARAMDKRTLNPYDLECLTLLAGRGLIEASTRPSRAPQIAYAHIYRVSEPAAIGINQWLMEKEM